MHFGHATGISIKRSPAPMCAPDRQIVAGTAANTTTTSTYERISRQYVCSIEHVRNA